MTNQACIIFEFDDVRAEPHTFTIYKSGTPLLLEPKTFLLLLFLLENRERVIEKREILDVIWKDTIVTENALTREIGKLRKSLGDDPKAPKYIQTVHTRGYRFIAAVEMVDATAEEQLPADNDRPSVPRRRLPAWVSAKALLVLAAIVALLATLFLRRNMAAAKAWEATSAPSRLAVLPFQSLGAGPNDKYVGLAMADALITKLSGSPRLVVRPTSTVLHYADPRQDSLALGRAMEVDYVLEGRFQAQSDRFRVTVQLLCISCGGTARWAASFDEKSADIFHVEDSISEKVVNALTLELTGEQRKRLLKRDTSNQDAHVAFTNGKVLLMQDTKEALDKATEFFERAVERDPNFAAAWAQLSDCYRRREWYGAAPSEVMSKTRAAALKSVALDDTLTYGHSMLGLVAFQYDWDFPTAEREYKRALEIEPGFIHQWHARYLLATNHTSGAEMEYRRFLQKSPFLVLGRTNAAQFDFLTQQYGRAAENLRETLDLKPNYAPAHEVLGLIYEQQGFQERAIQELQKAVDLSGGYIGLGSLGHLYAKIDRRDDVHKVIAQLATQGTHRYVAPFETALIHAGLGENDKAIDDLEKAYAERSLSAQALRFDPRLSAVRAKKRFHDFVKGIGLPF
jgi:DNA-binding winged helix-turn-helix (wHTH) protein/TolB-like protein